MISLDHNWQERNSIADDVMAPMLAEWTGHSGPQDLEFTAFYGIREYSSGAVLRNHVDRVDTHVVSGILQIGQVGMPAGQTQPKDMATPRSHWHGLKCGFFRK